MRVLVLNSLPKSLQGTKEDRLVMLVKRLCYLI